MLPQTTILDQPATMERIPLQSTALKSAGFDPEHHILEIEFRTGRVYQYADVPESVFSWLCRTKNKGAYVSRVIDARYSSQEVTEAPQEQDLLAALHASLTSPDD